MFMVKRCLLKITPRPIKNQYYDMKAKWGRPAEDVFNNIKEKNIWGSSESLSGPGSESAQTRTLETELPELFKTYGISSVLDIPCGDFNWMKNVVRPYAREHGLRYIGADIVDSLINVNKAKYGSEHIEFLKLDLVTDELPKTDLVFVRDCFVHFSYRDIQKAMHNIKKSGSKYLMSTTFTHHHDNHNIPTGDWRPINLQDAPFNFPEPEYALIEKCTHGDGAYQDKAMGLWRMEEL